TAERQRVDKVLEDAGIKLDVVASDLFGVSGTAMLRALVSGERDAAMLADLAKRSMRKKIPVLEQALRGPFGDHHGLMIGIALRHLDDLEQAIGRLDAQVAAETEPFATAVAHLDSIPGVGARSAQEILAEIGTDMGVFPTPATWRRRRGVPRQQRQCRQ